MAQESRSSSESSSCEFDFPSNPFRTSKNGSASFPEISIYPPMTRSQLLATVILHMCQNNFNTPLSLQEFLYDFKKNFTLQNPSKYDRVLKELGLSQILSFLQKKKAVVIEEDVLGYEIEQFVKYKDTDILKNLLIQYSHNLISPEFINFDKYYDDFEFKFKYLYEQSNSDSESNPPVDDSKLNEFVLKLEISNLDVEELLNLEIES